MKRGGSVVTALIVLAAAMMLFFAIARTISPTRATTIDANVETWLHLHASPILTEFMAAISFLGAPTTLSTVAVIGSILLLCRHRYAESATFPIIVLGGNLLNVALKHLFQRGRPVFDDPLSTLSTYSFPSGHAMASTVFYGLIAFHVAERRGLRQPAWIAIGAALSMVALVGFSRVYLGLHYLSDVLGGVAEGVAWLAVSWLASRSVGRGLAGGRL